MVQALADRLEEVRPEWTPFKIYCWVRKVIMDYGVELEKKPGGAPWFDLSMIVARPGRVWDIPCMGGPLDYSNCGELCARGTGDEYALGAAFATQRCLGPKATPKQIMINAIEAAKQYNDHCGGETWIQRLK